MSMPRKPLLTSAVLLACLTLTGCDRGPSDAAIRKAVRAEVAQEAVQMNQANNDLNGPPFGNPAFGNAQPGYNPLPTTHLTPQEQSKLDNLDIGIGTKTRQADGNYAVVVTIAGQSSTMDFIKGANGWQAVDDSGQ